jgi:hypothetical protein
MTNDPVLIAYGARRSRDRKRTYWNRIGCAYPHETGAGLTVVLDALPLDGRIFLLEPDTEDHKRIIKRAEAQGKTRLSNQQKKLRS